MIQRGNQLVCKPVILCRKLMDLIIDINTHCFVQQILTLGHTHAGKRRQVRSINNELEYVLIDTHDFLN